MPQGHRRRHHVLLGGLAEPLVRMTSQSRNNYSPKRIASIKRGLRRSWQPGGSHYKRFRARPVDEDTMRKRHEEERKGATCAGLTIMGSIYTVRHSMRRTDSYDILSDGQLVFTGGAVRVSEWIAGKLP